MIYQWDNILVSNFWLYLDHTILTQGQAFNNHSSLFYPVQQNLNGYYTYSAPFSQHVSDFSINNANIMTGCYINGVWADIGSNGLVDINYNKGQIYFSSKPSGPVSGNYAIKDINVVLPVIPHLEVLFDNKLELRPKVGKPLTGILDTELSFPAIFVKSTASNNDPFALGGLQLTKNNISCFIFADSEYLLNATCSIIRDMKHGYMPILGADEMPFNVFGGFKNGIPFNYTGITVNKLSEGSGVFIREVTITNFSRRTYGLINDMTPNAYFATADIELTRDRITY